MSLTERLQFLLTADVNQAVSGFGKVGAAADKDLGKAESKLDKVGGTLTKVGAGAVAFAGVAGAALWKVGSAAGDQNAAISAMEQVLGDASDAVIKWSDDSVKAVGLSKTAAIDAATQFGGIAKAAEMTGPQVANFAIEMTGLASDMAAFKNVKPEEALADLQSGFAGSTEVLRKYNIYLDDASLKSAYFRETGEKVTGTLTAQQRIIATHSEILRQSADIQGQWNRELDSNESKQAMFKANLDNLAASIGQGVVPVMSTVLGVLNNTVEAFESLPDPVKKAIGGFAAVGAGVAGLGGALSLAVGQVVKMRDNLTKLPAAFTAATAVVGVAAIAYVAYASGKAKAEAETREFVTALEQEGEAQSKATAEVIARRLAESDLLETMQAVGISVSDVAKIIRGENVPAFEAFRKVVERSGGSADDLKFALEDMGLDVSQGAANRLVAELTQMEGQFETAGERVAEQRRLQSELAGSTGYLAEQYKEMEDGVRAANQAQTDEQQVLTDGKSVLDEYAERQAHANEITNAARDAAREAADAERDRIDALHAGADAVFALQEANDDFRDKVQGLNEEIQNAQGDQEELNRIYRDAAQAGANVADSTVRLAEEQARQMGVTLSAKDSLDLWNRSAVEQAAQLTGPSRDALLDYIGNVNGIPPEKLSEIRALIDEGKLDEAQAALDAASAARTAAINADAHTAQAEEDLNNLARSRDAIIRAVGKLGAGFNAKGTDYWKGGLTWVGEEGPELIDLQRGAKVIPAPESAAMAKSAGSAGDDGGSTVNNFFPNATINQMVDVDAAVQRINLLLAS